MPKVAAIQMVSSSDLEENLRTADRWLMKAAEEKVDLVVLPENFSLFATLLMAEQGQSERTAQGPVRTFLSEAAKKYGLWIVAGSLPVADDSQFDLGSLDLLQVGEGNDKVYSRCFLFDNEGIEIASYDKIHLFDVDVDDDQGSYRESDQFRAGERVSVVDTPFGRLGLAICYDLRFPELFRVMFQHGVDIIALPAAFTQVTGEAHWETLLKARAIENFCTVIGANQGGKHGNNRETYGHSIIINAWGDVVAEIEKGEGLIFWEIDREKQQELRRKIPVNLHQRIQVPDQF